jgi:hypothetical protein
MSSIVDPFDVLVRLRPDVDIAALRPGEEPLMDALLERTLASANGRARPHSVSRRRKRRMFLGGLIVAVTGAAGTLTWALNRSERTADPRSISCNRTAELFYEQLAVERTQEDPVETCRRVRETHAPEWGPQPPSVACLLPTGIAGVFPGDAGTCAELGLPDLDSTLSEEDAKILAFQDLTTGEVSERGECLAPEDVADILNRGLEEVELTGWTVTIVGDYTEEQPCGSIEFVLADKTALVRPLPDMYGS